MIFYVVNTRVILGEKRNIFGLVVFIVEIFFF